MIIGAHSIIYSEDPEADREFMGDVPKLPNIDVGGGWLISDYLRQRWRSIPARGTIYTNCI